MREHLIDEEVIEVLEQNWDAVQTWMAAARSRQLAIGPAGAYWQRLPQTEMRCACEGLEIEWGPDLLWRLGVLEGEAAKVLNKDKTRGPSPLNPNRR